MGFSRGAIFRIFIAVLAFGGFLKLARADSFDSQCLHDLRKILSLSENLDQVVVVDFTSKKAREMFEGSSGHFPSRILRIGKTSISEEIQVWDQPEESIRNFLGLRMATQVVESHF